MTPPPKAHDPAKGEGPALLLREIDPVAEYGQDSGVPAKTGLVLTRHVVEKTIQAGSLLGMLFALPGTFFSKAQDKSLYRNIFRYAGRGTFIGIPLGIGMVAGKSYSMDGAGVDDRAYRVSHNAGQLRTDEFAMYGAAAGALSGIVAGMVPAAGLVTRIWNGASVGVGIGVLAHVATMPKEEKSARQLAKEAAEKMK